MGTAIVLLLLLALCGFIAYIGDLLGRRLGKKRLSIFGLRPKHTAILLTIVTGVLIATVSLGAALATVPGFRRAVMEGEKLVRANRRLRERNADQIRRQAELSAEIGKQSALNHELEEKNKALTDERRGLTEANTTLQGRNSGLSAANDHLTKESAGLQNLNQSLRGTNQKLASDNGRLSGANSRLSGANSRLQTSNSRLKNEAKALRLETEGLKEGQYVYKRNQQISFLPLPPNPPADQIRAAVTNLLYEARHPMGSSWTLPLKLEPPARYAGPKDDEAAMTEWVVRQASKVRNQRLVVRLMANENAVANRTIRARLEWYANQLVFPRREVIAEARVDGAGTSGAVLQELIYFLKQNVRGRALEKGVKPRDEGMGEVTYDQILAVCEEIRQGKGLARVVARARQDTYQAGPLNVDLEVNPIEPREAQRP